MSTVIDVTERPVVLLGWPDPDRVIEPSGVSSSLTVGSPSAVLIASAASIAGSTQVGTPEVDATMAPAGIASTASSGQPQLNILAPVYGVPSGAAVGTATAFTSMNPSGFSATGGGLGTPSLAMVMAPDGIASAEAFGDADTLATVFIIPGPVDPSNDFGNATATKQGWIFRPPVNTYKWRLFKEYEGISLIKEDGVWSEVAHPDLPRTKAAERYLAGGRDHVVGDALKAELEGLGYTVVSEVVTTEEYL